MGIQAKLLFCSLASDFVAHALTNKKMRSFFLPRPGVSVVIPGSEVSLKNRKININHPYN